LRQTIENPAGPPAAKIEPAGLPGTSGGYLIIYSIDVKPGPHSVEVVTKWDRADTTQRNMDVTAETRSGYVVITAHAEKGGKEIGDGGAGWEKGSGGVVIPNRFIADVQSLWIRYQVIVGGKKHSATWRKILLKRK